MTGTGAGVGAVLNIPCSGVTTHVLENFLHFLNFSHKEAYFNSTFKIICIFSWAKSKYWNAEEKNLKCHPMERLKTDQLLKGELLQVFQTRI
ncbi:MAG: hypothetical protein U9N07_06775, partial [Euryarchaeota archaeon]|nr:hypothetical protein [Euryarchaeota archaeon]